MGTQDYLLQLDIWVSASDVLWAPWHQKGKREQDQQEPARWLGLGCATRMPGDVERNISAKEVISLLGRKNIRKIFLGECSERTEELCGLHPWRSQTQCMLSWVPRWPQTKVSRSQEIISSLAVPFNADVLVKWTHQYLLASITS